MIFIILFMAGGFIFPLILDSKKHSGDNIFKRSGRDVLNYEITKKTFEKLHLSTKRISSTFTGMIILGSTVGVGYLAIRIVELVSTLFRFFLR